MDERLQNELDMLKSNINRMCLTKTHEKLDNMYECAKERLKTIYLIQGLEIEKMYLD